MENCIFCKIVKGEIPCIKIYEDNDFIAFEDIKPCNKGHTLIVPKEHSANILEMNEELGFKAFKLIKKIGEAAKKGLKAKGVSVAMIGEDVAHTHIHIIPRYEKDGLKFFKQKEVAEEEIIMAAEKIIKALY